MWHNNNGTHQMIVYYYIYIIIDYHWDINNNILLNKTNHSSWLLTERSWHGQHYLDYTYIHTIVSILISNNRNKQKPTNDNNNNNNSAVKIKKNEIQERDKNDNINKYINQTLHVQYYRSSSSNINTVVLVIWRF